MQNAESLTLFASAVLGQLTSLLHLDRSALYCIVLPNKENGGHEGKTIAATGDFVRHSVEMQYADLPPLVSQRFAQVMEQKTAQHFNDAYVVYTLADAVEARSKETGNHVKRVAMACEMLARLYGLPEDQVMLIKTASPLHDIGKVAIPDAILHKTGKLDAQEWALMQKHAQFGVDILQKSKRPLMRMGAEIALSHHERWDGTGYPNGLAGDAIPISGRITALADVFDELGSSRSYKEPWSAQRVAEMIQEGRGTHFEPALVDLLLNNLDVFNGLRQLHPDDSGDHSEGANPGER